jgi:hypothetical protein
VNLVKEFGQGMLGQDRSREGQEGLEVEGGQVREGVLEIRWGSPMLEGKTVVFNELNNAFMAGGDASCSCFPLVAAFSRDGGAVGVDTTTEVVVAFYQQNRVIGMGRGRRSRLRRRPFMGRPFMG